MNISLQCLFNNLPSCGISKSWRAGRSQPFFGWSRPLTAFTKMSNKCINDFFYISSFMFFYFSYPSIRIFEAIIMIGNLVLGISDPRADQRLLSSAKNRWKNFKIKFKQLTRVSNMISNARNCLNVFQWLVFLHTFVIPKIKVSFFGIIIANTNKCK